MNIQQLFAAVRDHPDEHSLIAAALELERQGYQVLVAGRYHGSSGLQSADEEQGLDKLPVGIGVRIDLSRDNESQSFLLHFLDLDSIGLTALNSPPIIYNPRFTVNEFRSD